MRRAGTSAGSLTALGVKEFSEKRDPGWRERSAPGMSLPLAALNALGAAALAGLAFFFLDRAAAKPFVPEAARGAPTLIVTGALFAVVLAYVTWPHFRRTTARRRGR
jgi:hypothetical protein